MDDGSEDEFGPGEVSLLPPGHDAWVVGDEPVVVIDISGWRSTQSEPNNKSLRGWQASTVFCQANGFN